MEKQDFLVYLHRDATTDLPFYVGIGQGIRPYQTIQRSQYWRDYVKANGLPKVEILHTDLTQGEAFEFEKKYILQFGRVSEGDGSLLNITAGGPGRFGLKMSEANKEKLRAANLGREISQDTRAKMAAAKLGTKRPERNEQYRENLALSQKSSKEVNQYDKSMTFVATHRSIHAAASAVGSYPGSIWGCLNGRQKTCAGYFWKYATNIHD